MVTGSYKATGEAFKLLPGGMRTGITSSSALCPDVETRIKRTSMNGEESEICVKSSKSNIFAAVFYKIQSCWREQVGTVVFLVKWKR